MVAPSPPSSVGTAIASRPACADVLERLVHPGAVVVVLGGVAGEDRPAGSCALDERALVGRAGVRPVPWWMCQLLLSCPQSAGGVAPHIRVRYVTRRRLDYVAVSPVTLLLAVPSASPSSSRVVIPNLRYTRARWVSTVRADRYSRSAMSRLLRPAAASNATSRSRAVSGSTPMLRASGGVRSPPARVDSSPDRCISRGGEAGVATLLVQLGQLGGGLGGEMEDVERLVVVDHCPQSVRVASGDGDRMVVVRAHQRSVHQLDELAESFDGLLGAPETDEVNRLIASWPRPGRRWAISASVISSQTWSTHRFGCALAAGSTELASFGATAQAPGPNPSQSGVGVLRSAHGRGAAPDCARTSHCGRATTPRRPDEGPVGGAPWCGCQAMSTEIATGTPFVTTS